MYTAKDYTHLLGLKGFSDAMITNHLTLYKGYVDNSNKLVKLLDTLEKGSYEYYECKRRLGWEIDGVRLHELYFENMNPDAGDNAMSENVKNLLLKNYNSLEEYKASLKRNGMMRGIGWVLLVQDNETKEVFHTWVGEHNVGLILNTKILLVMDCWEHAYMTDYGIKRADYIEAFMGVIDWKVVEARLSN